MYLYYLGFSRETEYILYVIHMIYYKELAHSIIEAEKSQKLQYES